MKRRILAALLLVACLCTTAHAASFVDVPDQEWYSEQVKYVSELGLMNGTSATEFSPDLMLSRGMMLTILYRMAGEPAVSGTGFTDVEPGKWYTAAAAWAGQTGIAQGSGDGTLGHEDTLTREQMAVMLYRYARHQGHDVRANVALLETFTDAGQVSSWAKEAVAWAVGNGLMQGAGGKLSPSNGADRAQTAVVIARFHHTWGRTEQTEVPVLAAKPGDVFYLVDPTPEVSSSGNVLLKVVCGGKVFAMRADSAIGEKGFYQVDTTVSGVVQAVSALPSADVDYRTAGVLLVDGNYETVADECVIYAIAASDGTVRVIEETEIADEDIGLIVGRNGYGYVTVLYVVDADK